MSNFDIYTLDWIEKCSLPRDTKIGLLRRLAKGSQFYKVLASGDGSASARVEYGKKGCPVRWYDPDAIINISKLIRQLKEEQEDEANPPARSLEPAPSASPAKATNGGPHRIYRSLMRDVTDDFSPFESFHDWFVGRCEAHGDKVAMVDAMTGREQTFTQIAAGIDPMARVLYHNFGVRKHSRVCLLAPNILEYPIVFHAVLRLGGVVSPLNPMFGKDEVAKHMRLAETDTIITISPLAGNIPDGMNTLFIDQEQPAAASLPSDYDGMTELDDTIVLPFSSGTTGMPKGVQLTNRNLLANIYQSSEAIQLNGNDVMMAVLPYFHIYGMVVILHMMIHVGGKQVVVPKFDMVNYLENLEKHKATLLFVAPPIMVGFAKHPATAKCDRSSVRVIISGAAPLGQAVQEMCEPLFPNAFIGQGYGLTETSPVLTVSPLDRKVYGSAGVLVPNTELRLVKIGAETQDAAEVSEGLDVEVGEEGEIWVSGPQVMKGYLRQEDTDKVFPEPGWFRTGDIGRIDENGCLYITDRLKELIKYKGYQVAPAELEALIQTHPLVQETIVVGIPAPDDESSELPRAHVALKPSVSDEDRATAAETIKNFVAATVAPYKQLRGGVKIVDSIPKTASGKLLRRVVKQQEMDAIKAAKEGSE